MTSLYSNWYLSLHYHVQQMRDVALHQNIDDFHTASQLWIEPNIFLILPFYTSFYWLIICTRPWLLQSSKKWSWSCWKAAKSWLLPLFYVPILGCKPAQVVVTFSLVNLRIETGLCFRVFGFAVIHCFDLLTARSEPTAFSPSNFDNLLRCLHPSLKRSGS